MESTKASLPHALQQRMEHDTLWTKCQFFTLKAMKQREEELGYPVGEYKDIGHAYPSNRWLSGRLFFEPSFKLHELNFAPPSEVEHCIEHVELQISNEQAERTTSGFFVRGMPPKFNLKRFTKLNTKLAEHSEVYETSKGRSAQYERMQKLPVNLLESNISINTAEMSTIGSWQTVDSAVDLLEGINETIHEIAYKIAGKMEQEERTKPTGDYTGAADDLLSQYVHAQDKIRFHRQMRLSGEWFHADVVMMNKLLDFASREMIIPSETEDGEPTDRLQLALDFLERRTEVFRKVLLKRANREMTEIRALYEKIHRLDKISHRHILLTDIKCLAETLDGHWNHAHATEIEKMYVNLVYDSRVE